MSTTSTATRTILRGLKGLRENLYLSGVSTAVIGAALLMVGMILLVQVNLSALVDRWQQDVHVSAYFREGLGEEQRKAAQATLAATPGVESATYVPPEEASAWMRTRMPDLEPLIADLGPDALPASLELTLAPNTPVEPLVAQLQGAGLYEDIDFGQEWVARFGAFVRLLQGLGLGIGGGVALASLFLVANTVHLVVYARRDELELMRLVGATDRFILSPFLVEGVAQGLLGGGAALGLLYALHTALQGRLSGLLGGLMGEGAQELVWLSPGAVGAMVAAGVLAGVLANAVSVTRFLRRLP